MPKSGERTFIALFKFIFVSVRETFETSIAGKQVPRGDFNSVGK